MDPLIGFEQEGDSPSLLSVHRVRDSIETHSEGLSTVRVRFDFGVEGTLSFTRERSALPSGVEAQ